MECHPNHPTLSSGRRRRDRQVQMDDSRVSPYPCRPRTTHTTVKKVPLPNHPTNPRELRFTVAYGSDGRKVCGLGSPVVRAGGGGAGILPA
jgi:hypothetical protein